MNIFLVRHGQTVANQNQVHQYSTTELSQTGILEAQLLAKRLKEAAIDHIFSSPFQRAKQTAEIIAAESGKSLQFLNELKEIKRPSEIEGKSHSDPLTLQVKQQITQNIHNPEWRYSNEENFWDVKKRVEKAMNLLIDQPEENILVVSHGFVIRMFLSLCLFTSDLTVEQFSAIHDHVAISNTGLTHCQFERSTGWRIMRVNDTEHVSAATFS